LNTSTNKKTSRLDYLKHAGNMPYLYMPREAGDSGEKDVKKEKSNYIK